MTDLFRSFDIENVDEFMESIINNYVLIVDGEKHRFAEIELYYKSKNHDDCRVFKRTNKNAGDIFFHRYGFDICFRSDDMTYGGALIRSLKNMRTNEFIRGPLKCSLELLNKNSSNIKFEVTYELSHQDIEKTQRIKGKCNNKYDEKEY